VAFCTKCGADVRDSRFCPSCGAAQGNATGEASSDSPTAAPASPAGGWKARGTNLTAAETATGLLWHGMSHEAGRNAHIRLYGDRIEREKPRRRMSMSSASQDHEVIPIHTVTSVNIKKAGLMLSDVVVRSGGGEIPFRFRHEDAQSFRAAIMPLVLATAPQPTVAPAALDAADQLRKLGELRDAGILSEDEFQTKKAQLLERM
jgi:hypothetical protein